MGRLLTIIITALVTCTVTSAFWFLAFNIGGDRADAADSMRAERRQARANGRRARAGAGPDLEVARGLVVGPAGLAIPVIGVKSSELVDTFTQARAGGARVHDSIDIMAPSGTPVVAAAPGKLEKLFFSKGGGGITAYVRSRDGRWSYYYAHLQEYAPGLTEGMDIKRGQMLGRVGFTGNADPAGPHLHFSINRMNVGDRFHQGSPVNPYPLLARR